MSRASLLIELLRLDYGLSDQAIASRCGVSRVHINYVLHGKRMASRELETRLSMLLDEYDRGERTLLPNTLARGKVSRGEPQKGPRVQPQRPVPKPEPHFTPSPKPASGLSARESKQVSNKPAPTPFVPSPVQHTSPTCVACQRPGVRTALYGGERLCQWCASARGYSVKTPTNTFVPLPTQHASFGVLSEPLPTQHEPGYPSDIAVPTEPIPETLTSPATWVFPRPGFGRDYQDYQRGMFCLACHAHTTTRQVRIANYTRARSVRLCEPCCERYGV